MTKLVHGLMKTEVKLKGKRLYRKELASQLAMFDESVSLQLFYIMNPSILHPLAAKSVSLQLFSIMNPSILHPLAALLSQLHSLTLSQLLYNSGDVVYIYKASSPTYTSAAVKIQRVFTVRQRAAMLAEGENLMQFKGHPNIVEFQGWLEYEAEGGQGSFIVIIAEMCDKDLMTDINQRKAASHYYYSEAQMWEYTNTLISVLAFLEYKGIAHRDIKPQNIFLSGTTPKIGDFGSSTLIGSTLSSYSTAGTPLFLSPLLKQALLAGNPKVRHNVYKSDVYSLGMTLLAMASLQEPPGGVIGLGNVVEARIASLHYSECFKSLLRLMLEADESKRPTFQALYYILFPPPDNPMSEEQEPATAQFTVQVPLVPVLELSSEDLSPDGEEGAEQLDFEQEDRDRNAEIERDIRAETKALEKPSIRLPPERPMSKAKTCCSVF